MHRIDGYGSTAGEQFTEGDPGQAIPATKITDAWLNAVQEEIANFIEAMGITLNKASNTQLQAALSVLVPARSWARAVTTGSYTNSTTTPTDVTGLGFEAVSGRTYMIRGIIPVTTGTPTAGFELGLKSSGAPTTSSVALQVSAPIGPNLPTTAHRTIAVGAFGSTSLITPGWLASYPYFLNVSGRIVTTGAGTIQVQARSESAGPVLTIHSGAHLEYLAL